MASNNSSVVQSFSIALIVFVMLTFVLAVTTYIFFRQADEQTKLADAAKKEASDANTKRLEAEKNRLELVKDVLGFPEDMANPEILERKRDTIDDVYGKYLGEKPEDRTYENALTWLSASIQKHYEQTSSLQGDKDRFAEQNKALAAKHDQEQANWKKSIAEAVAEKTRLDEANKKYVQESEAQKKELLAARQAADARAKKLEDLTSAIEGVATATYDPKGGAKESGKGAAKDGLRDERVSVLPENRKTEFMGQDEKGRVELLKQELISRARTISRLNDIIAQLRVADPALQATVLAATPKDDRVDEFDGRILSVNELDRTVLVSCGRTTGLRTGLKFNVYDPTDPQPQLGSKKAVVEVVAIESDSLVRCRVRQDSVRDPIIPGDVVATSLWSPGTPLEVVIVGITQFGGNPEGDRKRLDQLVERVGGTVAELVGPSTTMVIDAGPPQSKGIDAEGQVASRKFWTTKQKEYRTRQMDAAKQLGIKVVALDSFLDMLGLQVESVRANRLPVPIDPNAAPARAENVAF